jgi:alanine racemase
MACSAASTLYPTSLFNGMRLGLSLYGLYPAKEVTKIIKLKPALSWRTKIIQVKTLPAGSKIGYGGTYTVPNEQTIAILPIGYWDGLDRSLSNTGEVLVEGIHCPIRGRICMNLTMVDVSKIKNPKTGLVATIIGKSGGEILTAEDIAEKINTINYEVVDRINPLIPRIYR